MNYGTQLYALGGGKKAPRGAKPVGNSEWMWQNPSKLNVSVPENWYTNPPVQEVAGIGLGAVALAYGLWYLLYKSKK